MDELSDFLNPLNLDEINENNGFTDGQVGSIYVFADEMPDPQRNRYCTHWVRRKRGAETARSEKHS